MRVTGTTIFDLVAKFYPDKTVREIQQNTIKGSQVWTGKVSSNMDTWYNVFGEDWQVRSERGVFIRVGWEQ